MSIPKICPVLLTVSPPHMAKCREAGCAWFRIEVDPEDGCATGACALVSIADKLGNLAQQEAARSATNTTDGKGGTEFADAVSTSYDNGK